MGSQEEKPKAPCRDSTSVDTSELSEMSHNQTRTSDGGVGTVPIIDACGRPFEAFFRFGQSSLPWVSTRVKRFFDLVHEECVVVRTVFWFRGRSRICVLPSLRTYKLRERCNTTSALLPVFAWQEISGCQPGESGQIKLLVIPLRSPSQKELAAVEQSTHVGQCFVKFLGVTPNISQRRRESDNEPSKKTSMANP